MKSRREKRFFFSFRQGLLYLTNNGGRKGVQIASVTSTDYGCYHLRERACHLFCPEVRIQDCPPREKCLTTSNDSNELRLYFLVALVVSLFVISF